MSSVQVLDLSAVVLPHQGKRDTAVRPDFQFWHEVFDQAQGGGGESANRRAPDDLGTETAPSGQMGGRDEAAVMDRQPLDSEVPSAPGDVPSNASSQERQPAVNTLRAGLCTPTDAAIAGLALPLERASVESLGLIAVAEEAQAVGQNAAPPVSSNDHQVDVGLRAHVMATLDGQLKVVLRAHQGGLSVAQALVAVAQAVDQAGGSGGDVAQVVLNGACIYQQAVPARPLQGDTTAPRFELKC